MKRYKNIIIIKHNKRNTDSQGAIFVHCVVVIIYKVLSQNNLWPALQMNRRLCTMKSMGRVTATQNVSNTLTALGQRAEGVKEGARRTALQPRGRGNHYLRT